MKKMPKQDYTPKFKELSVKRLYKVTTDSKHNLPVAPNLPERNITPDVPSQD